MQKYCFRRAEGWRLHRSVTSCHCFVTIQSHVLLSVPQPFRHLSCNPYCYEYKYFTEKGCGETEKNKVFVEDSSSFFNSGRTDYLNHRKGPYLFKKKSCRCLQ
jgi:hypothetical protein